MRIGDEVSTKNRYGTMIVLDLINSVHGKKGDFAKVKCSPNKNENKWEFYMIKYFYKKDLKVIHNEN